MEIIKNSSVIFFFLFHSLKNIFFFFFFGGGDPFLSSFSAGVYCAYDFLSLLLFRTHLLCQILHQPGDGFRDTPLFMFPAPDRVFSTPNRSPNSSWVSPS